MQRTMMDETTRALAEELAALTGETVSQTVRAALEERLGRMRHLQPPDQPDAPAAAALADGLDRIAVDCARLPVRDDRPADLILGYDAHGLPS
ncbi:MAG: hypothetical protein GVY13_18200 [Alphaproteobacteria bacterium]|jgi:antitoxin VapB|nr:hypothetical protein [Alphaproteobacteria bacterium]